MTEQCVFRLENKEQLKTIQEDFPYVVKAFLSDNCAHCDGLKPELESQCQQTDGLMPFKVVPTLHCPVEEPFCKEELVGLLIEDYKKQNGVTGKLSKKQLKKLQIGVPVVFGQASTGEIHFSVHGNSPSLLDQNYSAIRETIERTKEKWVKESGR